MALKPLCLAVVIMFPIFGASAVFLDADPFVCLFGENAPFISKPIRTLLMHIVAVEIGKCGSVGLTISVTMLYLVSTSLRRLNQVRYDLLP